jgi:hypothetical protein
MSTLQPQMNTTHNDENVRRSKRTGGTSKQAGGADGKLKATEHKRNRSALGDISNAGQQQQPGGLGKQQKQQQEVSKKRERVNGCSAEQGRCRRALWLAC